MLQKEHVVITKSNVNWLLQILAKPDEKESKPNQEE